ncbi:DMT family transporter [Pelagibacteraceae bacterium]|nr:DMT family transporter [Pelagibacteraceae bacterium]
MKYLPLSFIILWSSAFISGQFIVLSSSPFAALFFRFIIVSICFLIFAFYLKEKILIESNLVFQASVTGILFHGFYLGGVFFSYSVGLSATLSALIVGLQPILTNIFSGPILKEKVNFVQWTGVTLGFTGTIMVIGYDIGISIPIIGIIASIIALLGATTATIWQKKFTNNISLSVNNFYQAFAAAIFLIVISLLFETPFISFDNRFIISMGWQIIMVSFGAYAILMYLIKKGTASKTSNLFFLVPPVTAIMAYFILGEKLYLIDIFGLVICAFGVYIATRK